ncbi:MAG: hypothetical protein ACOX5J_15440 [Candidatus Hydrogenedentales bacterium]|jgi:hypothetical protein
MNSRKKVLLFLLWFLLSSGLSASDDIMSPSNGRQQPGAISLEERQRVEYEDAESDISLSISASARIVSVFRWDTNAWEFFEYSEAEDAWRGSCTWEVDRAEFGVACMAWALMPDGSDVFWEVEPPHRTFRLAGGAIEQIKRNVEVTLPIFDTKTGRLARRGRLTTVADLISQEQFGWAQALLQEEGQDQEVPDGTSASVRADTVVLDVAPDHTAFLCLVDSLMRLGPLRSFESDGKVLEYWPANARPKAFDQGAWGSSYSPDGRFVMANFRYDDDGHEFWSYDKDGQIKGMPGTVQIFTREGEFQTEVFVHAYRENLPVSYAQAYWLRDDWIVYTSPYDLVFVKVLYK